MDSGTDEGQLKWIDGSDTSGYSNFENGQPDNITVSLLFISPGPILA